MDSASRAKSAHVAVLLTSAFLTGCGTYVPVIQEPWEGTSSVNLTAGGFLELKIKQKVYCSIIQAVIDTRRDGLLPPNWAAQVTLDLQVDETGATNPGVTFVQPLTAMQSTSTGVSATLSSQGTREDKFGSYWSLDKLKYVPGNSCYDPKRSEEGSSLLLESDLRISEWLHDALFLEGQLPSSDLTKKADSVYKQDFLSYHVKFVVITNGSVNPVWKLTRLTTGNGSLPLLSANRTRTHDLLVTFGPAYKVGTPNLAIQSHEIQEFGIASSNGNRTVFSPILSPQ